MTERTYCIEEVAKTLKVSVRSVFRYIHEGKLRATKIGYWRISGNDLKQFVAESANIKPKKEK